ncbi:MULTISPECIES: type II toxin-antitoxin system RelB/DinJ family antitoxin [unclassified Adlercreutzia]|uniref:type II toxin-antitoxin system RelB/DinJ family antitoxin n=1 Tax=unclassified Adlercreutzia TaxID=2636013 RepID=UPI0013EB3082|nr:MULTISPECIES: type II toxin-antitoxin system RelB/DinJ family antitoxin [unclassified Adlercreutzia]
MESVLTVRLDAETKERGARVIRRYGLTPSQSVRELFAYAVRNDALPFESAQKPSREEVARRIAAFDACHTKEPLALSDEELRNLRLRERYGLDG